MSTRDDWHLLIIDSHGIYIPQFFVQQYEHPWVRNVTGEDRTILEAGPDHEHYWEAWEMVLNNGQLMDMAGRVYNLHQDGDLWAVPEDYDWDQEDSDD